MTQMSPFAERNQQIYQLAAILTYSEIGKKFGISRQRAYQIVQRETQKRKGILASRKTPADETAAIVLRAIAEFKEQKGYLPTQFELSALTGIPQTRISYAIRKLKEKGILQSVRGDRLYLINPELIIGETQ
ncbi:MAG: MarR family transcriptional regulator [Anaerolineales bacterium]